MNLKVDFVSLVQLGITALLGAGLVFVGKHFLGLTYAGHEPLATAAATVLVGFVRGVIGR